jgi:hypothetical protein
MASEMAITSQLDLTNFKAMGAAKSRRVTVNPENFSGIVSSTTSTQDIYFTLPSGRYSFINGQNSYISFELRCKWTNTDGTATAIGFDNGSASSLFRTMEVQLQSQSVELLDKYNVFAALVEDFQPLDRSGTIMNIMSGGGSATAAGSVPLAKQSIQLGTLTAFGAPDTTASAAKTGAWFKFCVPLYSSVLGTLQQQYMPAADGIRLRLTIESSDVPIVWGGGGGISAYTYEVQKMALQMDYLDVAPEVHSQLVAEAGGVLRQHGSAVSNFGTTFSAGSQQSILIPARFSSLKNYFTTFRLSSGVALATINSTGARTNPYLNDYVYRIDGRNYPAVNVVCGTGTSSGTYSALAGEAFMELVKCFHALHSAQFDCVFNGANYINTTGTANASAFAIGIDMEQDQAGKVVISGMDTNSSNTYLDLNCAAAPPSAVNVDTFAIYDLIVEYDAASGALSFSK